MRCRPGQKSTRPTCTVLGIRIRGVCRHDIREEEGIQTRCRRRCRSGRCLSSSSSIVVVADDVDGERGRSGLVDWLVGWLVDGASEGGVGWLVGWLVGWCCKGGLCL
jgi:hypothetical protein